MIDVGLNSFLNYRRAVLLVMGLVVLNKVGRNGRYLSAVGLRSIFLARPCVSYLFSPYTKGSNLGDVIVLFSGRLLASDRV